MTPTCEPPSHLDQHVPNDRCWPKADVKPIPRGRTAPAAWQQNIRSTILLIVFE
jgi:hypothetical protein